MARHYYFKHWNEVELFIGRLDCYGVAYEIEVGVNFVDEGYDNLVTVDGSDEGIAEHCAEFILEYPYDEYLADKAAAIAEGVDPRRIMSYSAVISYEEFQAELEREQEVWDSYDEYEHEAAIAAEVQELDELLDMVEMSEETAKSELEAFGRCDGWFFGSAEAPVVYETGFQLWEDDRWDGEWEAWNAASEDIPDTEFFELNLSL